MNNATHKISWFVWAGDQMIPRESSMRGTWGYDAKCSCGWESRVGGGTYQYVRDLVADHKAGGNHLVALATEIMSREDA